MVSDKHFMQEALQLAKRGRGWVEPNPMVGAVIVAKGKVIGKGYHRRFGGPHAEIEAIRNCPRPPKGATAFVTLEPCCHVGKTGPCTQALIDAGIRRVVVAMKDPFAEVAGKGIRRLRRAEIQVDLGLCAEETRVLNRPYLKRIQTGKPYVILKWAQSLDGRIAAASGQSKWISSDASRRKVHRLRCRCDGILVGIGTALADNPHLTVRGVPRPARTPTRVILDRRLRLPMDSFLVQTAKDVPVLIACSQQANARRASALRRAGCEILELPSNGNLDALLTELGHRGWTNLLVEGGSQVLTSFIKSGLADELHVFIAPKLFGSTALPPLGPLDPSDPDTPAVGQIFSTTRCGDDVYVISHL